MSGSQDASDNPEKVPSAEPKTAARTEAPKEPERPLAPEVAAFCEQIKKDAEQEIRTILGKAEHSAARKAEDAEKEMESFAGQIRNDAEAQAKRIEARARSDVALEMRKALLRAEGRIIDEVVNGVREALRKLHGKKAYSDYMKQLTAQGILALEDAECIVAPSVEDRALYTAQFMQQIKRLVKRKSGKEPKLSVSQDLSPRGSGVRVYSAAGNVLYDNTLDARMERLADELRAIVAREVFAEEKAEPPEEGPKNEASGA